MDSPRIGATSSPLPGQVFERLAEKGVPKKSSRRIGAAPNEESQAKPSADKAKGLAGTLLSQIGQTATAILKGHISSVLNSLFVTLTGKINVARDRAFGRPKAEAKNPPATPAQTMPPNVQEALNKMAAKEEKVAEPLPEMITHALDLMNITGQKQTEVEAYCRQILHDKKKDPIAFTDQLKELARLCDVSPDHFTPLREAVTSAYWS